MIIETPYEDMVAIPQDLIEDIHYHLSRYDSSTSRTNAGFHLTQLSDKISDLKTWHPTFDVNTGTIAYEREND